MPRSVTFELPDPSYEKYHWVWESEHAPGAQPPLTRDMFSSMWPEPGDGPPDQLDLHGYSYSRVDDPDAEWRPPPPPDDGLTALQRWEQKWLPRVDALLAELIEFDPSSVPPGDWQSTLDEQASKFGRVFGGVHMQTVSQSGEISRRFIEDDVALLGEERRADALALMQGFDNCTSERAVELWELSRQVRARPELRESLSAWDGDDAGAVDGDFGRGFAGFLERWGFTMDGFVQDLRSWRENPRVPLALILREADQPVDASPALAAAAQSRRRAELEQELRSLPESEAAAALVAALPAAQEVLPKRENHNFLCDQRLTYASRQRWLSIGRHLLAQGRLEDASSVFYLFGGELVDALEGRESPPPATLQERLALQQVVRAADPPSTLGKPLPGTSEGQVAQLSGTAASPGVFRGRARIVRTIEEAIDLDGSDVLVCGVTSPAWTHVFATIGALVTDAGSDLSHPAIVAREYGLPAVVGTKRATSTIPDGATIEVDGDRGIVTIEPG